MEQRKEKAEFKDKFKVSYYIDPKTEERLIEISLKRTKAGKRTRKSQIVDEAVELLYKQENTNTTKIE